MQQVSHADLFEKIGAVVAGAAVHAEADRNVHLQHLRYAGDAGGQLHVRDRAVADAGAGLCEKLKLLCIEMNSVGVPHIVADPAQLLHIGERPQADLLEGVVLLILRLAQMRVQANMILTREDGALPQQILGDRER